MTFDALHPGDTVTTPRRTITDSFFTLVTALAGFTHPMFTDRQFGEQSLPFDGQPIPGEASLLLLGGLAEQTGIFEGDNLVLAGMDGIRFRKPVVVGDTIEFDITVLDKERTGDRGTIRFECLCKNQRGEVAFEASLTLRYFLAEPGGS